jgi:hypothetical protein
VHTAPPRPPFIHCAQLSLQPPDDAPPQLRVAGAASAHVPDAGFPNSWTTGAGTELDDELEEDDAALNPPPARDHVAIDVIGVPLRSLDNLEKIVAFTVPASKTGNQLSSSLRSSRFR